MSERNFSLILTLLRAWPGHFRNSRKNECSFTRVFPIRIVPAMCGERGILCGAIKRSHSGEAGAKGGGGGRVAGEGARDWGAGPGREGTA
jgi:hypothetical protein